MEGNVAEWVINPKDPDGKNLRQILKGAHWFDAAPEAFRLPARTATLGFQGYYIIGFRCARSVQ